MSGDGGTEVVQRINKRDLLRRIEALETTVQTLTAMLRARPQPLPDIGRTLVGTPPLWPYHPYPLGPAIGGAIGEVTRCSTRLIDQPRNTRLEN